MKDTLLNKWESKLARLRCPVHKCEFVTRRSAFGFFAVCSVVTCDYMATIHNHSGKWIMGDAKTHAARRNAHAIFDELWLETKMRRGTAYKRLAEYLGIKEKDCHIGFFDAETCERVIEFTCKRMKKG